MPRETAEEALKKITRPLSEEFRLGFLTGFRTGQGQLIADEVKEDAALQEIADSIPPQ